MKRSYALLPVLLLAIGWWWYVQPFEPAAAMALDGRTPLTVCGPQSPASTYSTYQQDGGAAPFRVRGHTLTPFATFGVDARVLSHARYKFDHEAQLAPVDLALGWGPMAAPSLPGLHIGQSDRWYHYSWGPSGPPMSPDLIAANSADMHIIPSTKDVARTLEGIRTGDHVSFTGYLVDITKGGWSWHSSRSRYDTGDGACEVVYVCGMRVARAA